MNEFTVRADSVNVEEIMERIRTKIREKRGVDYTEEEIQRLANVKLEQFLDPASVRSDLVQQYRRKSPSAPMPVLPPLPPRPVFPPQGPLPDFPLLPPLPPPEALRPLPPPLDTDYRFDPDTMYASSRGAMGRALMAIRRLLNPILKLFFNPGSIAHALHVQSVVNTERLAPSVHRELDQLHTFYSRFHGQVQRTYEALEQFRRDRESFQQVYARLDRYQNEFERIHDHFDRLHGESDRFRHKFAVREEVEALSFEMLNNLVVEVTKLGIETKNVKMRLESLASRLDFDERRARALEGVVQYRVPIAAPPPRPQPPPPVAGGPSMPAEQPQSADQGALRSRRRRRRGRRRAGGLHGEPAAGAGQPARTEEGPDHADGAAPFEPSDSSIDSHDDAGGDFSDQ
jgi:hypothetical protein